MNFAIPPSRSRVVAAADDAGRRTGLAHPAGASSRSTWCVTRPTHRVGLWLRDRRRKALAEVSDWHSEEIGAIKLADIHADKAYVTGEHEAIPEPGDGEAIEPWINEPWRQAKASKARLG